MSYIDRIMERTGLYVSAIDGSDAAGATQQVTSDVIDMDETRQVAFILRSLGTGTVDATIQYGVLTSSSAGGTAVGNKYGNTSGGVAEYNTLTVGEDVQTFQLTGEDSTSVQGVTVLQTDAQSLPANTRYLRAIMKSGTANTFATLHILTADVRYPPATSDSDVSVTTETEIAE
jgi:hypothetical protein